MNKRNHIILAGCAVLALAVVLYLFFGISSEEKKTASAPQTGANPHQGHGGAATATQPEAALQPAAAETKQENDEETNVEIPPEKQQMIGVRITAAEIKPMTKTVRTVGIVEYDERRLATVNMKFEGYIEKLYVDYSGRYVKRGERLAEIYSPELLATQQEFISLLKWSKEGAASRNKEVGTLLTRDSNAIVEGARQRLRLWDISEDQIASIEQTGKPVRTLVLLSPASGYVVQKTIVRGQRVMPGEKLFDIADLSTVWVVSDIFEYELPLIKAGDRAMISLSYFPGKEFSSTIDYVYPTISGETRTAKVRFTIPNPGNKLKPQMYTNVEVKINLGKKLVIPEDAVLDSGKRQIVYVDKGEGNFEPRAVTTGIKTGGMIEIVGGLRAGERVASSANFLIDSEARLKGVVK
jgi:membrane fusion protein, copper/silver efflux system